jgi:hypothetical protein
MAHKCNTDGGKKWKSTIKRFGGDEDDGFIKINKEDSDGVFTGKHEKSSHDLFGRCRETSGDAIWFVVPSNNHLYIGKLLDEENIQGQRFMIDVDTLTVHPDLFDKSDDEGEEAPVDDEWVAVKTT